MTKPFSQACENNKGPILGVLKRYLVGSQRVLEVGSGTGQHAVFFGASLPGLVWQCSDLPENHAGIQCWIDDSGLANVRAPLELDVSAASWPADAMGSIDAVFSANTAHIMSWRAVCALVRGVGERLGPGGLFLLYGPFNYRGDYTSESNARFDQWLTARDPASAIRGFEDVDREARQAGLVLVEDCEMPANNRLLVWRRAD